MARVLVDATVVLAFADTNDQDHDRGEEIVRGIDHGDLPTGMIVHEALLEVLNFLNERKGHQKAVTLLDLLAESAHYHLPANSRANIGIGKGIFRQFPDLSLGDAMQVAFMQSEDIEYIYSFDDDFDAVDGVIRLNSATNPFV